VLCASDGLAHSELTHTFAGAFSTNDSPRVSVHIETLAREQASFSPRQPTHVCKCERVSRRVPLHVGAKIPARALLSSRETLERRRRSSSTGDKSGEWPPSYQTHLSRARPSENRRRARRVALPSCHCWEGLSSLNQRERGGLEGERGKD